MCVALMKSLLIVLLLGLCLPAYAEPIRFARAKSVMALPLLIAEAKDYFAAEGLDIRFVETKAGKQAMGKMLNGEADLAVVGSPPVARGFLDHMDYCVVASVTEADNAEKVVVSRASGIRSVEGLVGKRVGVSKGTGADYGFREFLFLNGLETSDMEVVNVRPGPLSKGLEANDLDALVLWEPLASRVHEVMGAEFASLDTQGLMLLDYVMIATPQMAGPRIDELQKVLRAVERANRFITEHREDAIAILSRQLQLSPQNSTNFLNENLYRLSLGPRLVHALERLLLMMVEDQPGASVPDIGPLFCPAALQKVVPKNIQLLRE